MVRHTLRKFPFRRMHSILKSRFPFHSGITSLRVFSWPPVELGVFPQILRTDRPSEWPIVGTAAALPLRKTDTPARWSPSFATATPGAKQLPSPSYSVHFPFRRPRTQSFRPCTSAFRPWQNFCNPYLGLRPPHAGPMQPGKRADFSRRGSSRAFIRKKNGADMQRGIFQSFF